MSPSSRSSFVALAILSTMGLGCPSDPPIDAGESQGSSTGVGDTGPTSGSSGPGQEAEADSTASGGPSSDGPGSDDTTGPGPDLPPTRGCTLNSECAEHERCDESGRCIGLLSAECPTLHWPASGRDDVIFVGSIIPVSPPLDETFLPLENAHRMAIDDFNAVADDWGDVRSIAWVGCDSTPGPEAAIAAAEHLRDVVGAPAIIGPVLTDHVLAVAEQVTIPAGIFVMTPTMPAASIVALADDDLVWSSGPRQESDVPSIVDWFLVDVSPAPVRMLLLHTDDVTGVGLQAALSPVLEAALGAGMVTSVAVPLEETFASGADQRAAYDLLIEQALAQPGLAQDAGSYTGPGDHYTHVLVLAGAEAQPLVVSYADRWNQQYAFAPLPMLTITREGALYMAQAADEVEGDPSTTAAAPAVHQQLRGLLGALPLDPGNFVAFNIRYQIAFGSQAPVESALAYDATMATLLASLPWPPDQPLTGSDFAAGLPWLVEPSGDPVDFGEQVGDFMFAALAELTNGHPVDLFGVSGGLDWDPSTGDLPVEPYALRLLGTPASPSVDLYCSYAANPPPATDGTWVSVATGLPPCN